MNEPTPPTPNTPQPAPPQQHPVPRARPVAVDHPTSPPVARPADLAPLDLSYLTRRQAALDAVLVLCAAIIAPYLPALMAVLETPGDITLPSALTLLIGKWAEMLLVVVLAAYLVLRNGLRPRSFGLHLRRFGQQLAWAPLILMCAYLVMIGVGVLVTVFIASFGGMDAMEREATDRMEFANALPWENVTVAASLLVAVAIHEELLFRGLLLPLLRRATGSWTVAVAASSVVFGLLHFQQGTMAVIQVMGLAVVLATMFILSRSLLAVILAHFAFDMIQLQLVRFMPHIRDLLNNPPPPT